MQRGNCVCGHPRDTHQHFRSGTDCGQCGAETCPKYRPQGGLAGLLRSLRPSR